MEKKTTSYRLMPQTLERLDELARVTGLPKQSIIDEAIRQYADERLPEAASKGK